MKQEAYVSKGADISLCGTYRYLLWREWRGVATKENWRWLEPELGEPKSCLFVMLNPSTADGDNDDPTIKRCVSFAKREKFDRLEVVNLFAFRSSNPERIIAMKGTDDALFAPRNQDVVERAAMDAGLIIVGWGVHGAHCDQDEAVLGWLDGYGKKIYCLGLTKDGFPRHPLYVKGDAPLTEYRGRPDSAKNKADRLAEKTGLRVSPDWLRANR